MRCRCGVFHSVGVPRGRRLARRAGGRLVGTGERGRVDYGCGGFAPAVTAGTASQPASADCSSSSSCRRLSLPKRSTRPACTHVGCHRASLGSQRHRRPRRQLLSLKHRPRVRRGRRPTGSGTAGHARATTGTAPAAPTSVSGSISIDPSAASSIVFPRPTLSWHIEHASSVQVTGRPGGFSSPLASGSDSVCPGNAVGPDCTTPAGTYSYTVRATDATGSVVFDRGDLHGRLTRARGGSAAPPNECARILKRSSGSFIFPTGTSDVPWPGRSESPRAEAGADDRDESEPGPAWARVGGRRRDSSGPRRVRRRRRRA